MSDYTSLEKKMHKKMLSEKRYIRKLENEECLQKPDYYMHLNLWVAETPDKSVQQCNNKRDDYPNWLINYPGGQRLVVNPDGNDKLSASYPHQHSVPRPINYNPNNNLNTW